MLKARYEFTDGRRETFYEGGMAAMAQFGEIKRVLKTRSVDRPKMSTGNVLVNDGAQDFLNATVPDSHSAKVVKKTIKKKIRKPVKKKLIKKKGVKNGRKINAL